MKEGGYVDEGKRVGEYKVFRKTLVSVSSVV